MKNEVEKIKDFERMKIISSKLEKDIKEYLDDNLLSERRIQMFLLILGVFVGSEIVMGLLSNWGLSSNISITILMYISVFSVLGSVMLFGLKKIFNFKFSINIFNKKSKFNILVKENLIFQKNYPNLDELEKDILHLISKDISLLQYFEEENIRVDIITKTDLYQDLNEAIENSRKLYRKVKKLHNEYGFLDADTQGIKHTLKYISKLKCNVTENKNLKYYELILLLGMSDRIINFNLFIENIIALVEANSKKELKYVKMILEDILTEDVCNSTIKLEEDLENIFNTVDKIVQEESKLKFAEKTQTKIKDIIKDKEVLEL